ncbi:class I SAM-dependent methyltransferase [Turicibacter sp. TJ11]|uniref:tRNA (adenine(22)-N(1))-methyltransferase n=1 Tax=Turicibacter sp. TJ11 TaxID=2806443 RepID=UPI001F39E8EA|nr:class I SAM-dependent methyltransferase [Turicibacter sp. TJ11]
MNYELSLRLQTCLNALTPLQTVADVGTDHAYLPCVGILNGKLKKAIAADIGKGPLEAAKTTIQRYGLTEQIETRLGPGLTVLHPSEVEGVVIAGMGGKLIVSILEENLLLTRSFERLVLQPNIDANVLRDWLSQHQFNIIDEKIVLDEGKFYEIIVAVPVEHSMNYNELDIEFGPVLRLDQTNEIFHAKWSKEFMKNQSIIEQLPTDHPRVESLKQRQALLKEVL